MSGAFPPVPPRRRVLVVDDSTFMRIALRRIIESEGMTVVGEARNGREAVELARDLKPDIITMDVEMPELDGLGAMKQIIAERRPAPIMIMVSGHTQRGTEATIKALSLGAVDFVSKSSPFAAEDLGHVDSELKEKLRYWASQPAPLPIRQPASATGPRAPAAAPIAARPVPRAKSPRGQVDLVVVACSTGGPQMLAGFLAGAAPLGAPMIVAQHMPALFTTSLANLLRNDTGLDVREGAHRMALPPGSVTIIPGGGDGIVARAPAGFELRLTTHESLVHPCADLLFETAAMVARHPVAVIMTGMGNDGTKGAQQFLRRRLPVLVQDPKTCVVSGMPTAAIDAGVATEVLTPAGIGQKLVLWTGAGYTPRTDLVETP
ncbi:MAG TPA: chemotaxis-specific protein-glutamate methyltransferase CheB [Reyranella sp.]|nr:chemotaxis-specific protein-glutamate methyltransferase CheB [Reyranella sp.]